MSTPHGGHPRPTRPLPAVLRTPAELGDTLLAAGFAVEPTSNKMKLTFDGIPAGRIKTDGSSSPTYPEVTAPCFLPAIWAAERGDAEAAAAEAQRASSAVNDEAGFHACVATTTSPFGLGYAALVLHNGGTVYRLSGTDARDANHAEIVAACRLLTEAKEREIEHLVVYASRHVGLIAVGARGSDDPDAAELAALAADGPAVVWAPRQTRPSLAQHVGFVAMAAACDDYKARFLAPPGIPDFAEPF